MVNLLFNPKIMLALDWQENYEESKLENRKQRLSGREDMWG